MKFSKYMLQLYAVTDRRWLGDGKLSKAVEQAILGGATMVQLREKNLSDQELLSEARELVKVCHYYGRPLIVDDNVRVCMESGADGVHVGQSDLSVAEARHYLGPDRIIGATAHDLKEAKEAEQEGADYLGCGAAFGSSTKKDSSPISLETYTEITKRVHIPVCAIGGISTKNMNRLYGHGLNGVAVISGIFAQKDIKAASRELLRLTEFL